MTGPELAREITTLIAAVQSPGSPSVWPIPARELSDAEKEQIADRIACLLFGGAVRVEAQAESDLRLGRAIEAVRGYMT